MRHVNNRKTREVDSPEAQGDYVKRREDGALIIKQKLKYAKGVYININSAKDKTLQETNKEKATMPKGRRVHFTSQEEKHILEYIQGTITMKELEGRCPKRTQKALHAKIHNYRKQHKIATVRTRPAAAVTAPNEVMPSVQPEKVQVSPDEDYFIYMDEKLSWQPRSLEYLKGFKAALLEIDPNAVIRILVEVK